MTCLTTPSRPARGRRDLLLVICAFATTTSCGFFVRTGVPKSPPGAALEAFARDLGVDVAVRAEDKNERRSDPARLDGVDDATLARFFAEGREAQSRLQAAYGPGGRPDLDALPRAEDRVASLARARGLVLDLNRQREAQALLATVLEEEPRHVIALELMAESKRRDGDVSAAVRTFRELSAAFPEHPRFRLQLARVLIHHKATDETSAASRESIVRGQREGERILESLIEGPLGIEACSELCVRLLEKFQPERAESITRKALRVRPRHPELEFLLGRALRYQGRYEAALELLTPITRLDASGGLVDDARYQVVWCLRGLERFEEARRQLAVLKERADQNGMASLITPLEPALAEEAQKKRRVSFSLIELRYLVRKSPDKAQRENALEILMQNIAAVDGVDADFLHVLRRDAAPDLRARALVASLRIEPRPARVLEIGLKDPTPRNRLIAAGQCRRLQRDDAVPLLFAALAREEEPSVFRGLHESLSSVTGTEVFLQDEVSETDEGRAGVVQGWASRLGLRNPKDKN